MIVEITTRHTKASGVHEYAERKVNELGEAFPRIEHVQVVFDIQKHLHEAELIIRGKTHLDVEAKGTADAFGPALDIACERAVKQLRRFEDKIQEHRKRVKEQAVEENGSI